MIVDISAAHNIARLAGTLAFLDTGSGNASVELYGNTKPSPGAAAGADPLVVIALSKPAGVLTTVLTLQGATAEGELVMNTGTVAWARFKNGAGSWVMDTDASIEGGDGAVQLPTLTLYAGGRCPLSPSTIG